MLVVAKAVSVELELSAREVILNPIPGYLAETEFRTTVSVYNPRNHPAEFTWKPIITERGTAFSIQPAKGILCKYSVCACILNVSNVRQTFSLCYKLYFF